MTDLWQAALILGGLIVFWALMNWIGLHFLRRAVLDAIRELHDNPHLLDDNDNAGATTADRPGEAGPQDPAYRKEHAGARR